ncbi:MAG TPA: penicillin acylase family protein [Micropepsaceae bacterium]|nr:penicillin acylase family protein [Micropepsaceae bacterium]
MTADTLTLLWRLARDYLRRAPLLDVRHRLAMIPLSGAPVSHPVGIWWDEHQVPFIDAESDEDLAVALGVVHAHLRLAQLEVMRRASRGRLSELLGRRALMIDKLVRTFDIARAVPQIIAAMPPSTVSWLEGFVRGINHMVDHGAVPRELPLLGLPGELWTVADVVALGRLVSADVNWLVWMRILRLRGRRDWPQLWREFCSADMLSVLPSDSGQLSDLLAGTLIRSGSNAFAAAGSKSSSGAAIIASDPHLSINLPNNWLLTGMRSPSHQEVGMMIPGIPFMAVGRNPWIAWGGTSLHAASSDLVLVPDGTPLQTREESISVLKQPPVSVPVREAPWGPVISDLAAFAGSGTVALRWMGHQPSDEFTAMLRVGAARNWQDFRDALAGYAVPGLEMVFAAATGEIGRVTAVRLPDRSDPVPSDILAAPENGWQHPWSADKLPCEFQPQVGFIASANARLPDHPPVIGYHFSPPIRKQHLEHLLGAAEQVSIANMKRLQADVCCESSLMERDNFCAWLAPLTEHLDIRDLLAAWDGGYHADSKAALAHETLFVCLARDLLPPDLADAYQASWGTRVLIWRAIVAAAVEARQAALARAAASAAEAIKHADWGARHRLVLQHPLAMLPFFGRRYRIYDLPASGTSETLMKTAHPLTTERHRASYGSVSRHVSDLADADANYFALLGGQDGWIGSTTFADQVELWQRGAYVQIPLRIEAVETSFAHRTLLSPG